MTMDWNIPNMAAQYEQDGVLALQALYDTSRLEQIHDELARYIRDIAPKLPESDVVFESDATSVRNLWRMDKHDQFFANLAADKQLLELVSALVHGQPVLMTVQAFNKPAKIGSGVPPHQDNAYFCQSPPDALTVWIALDPVTEENGPIYYVRASHEAMRRHKPSGVAGNSVGLAHPFDTSDPLVGTLQAGGALVHHCQTIHWSKPNKTDRPRRGLLMVFRGQHTREDPALRKQYTLGGAST